MINTYTVGDHKNLLKTVPSGLIELVYVDPPYCTGRNFHHFDDRFQSTTEYRENFIRPMIKECHRTLTPTGNIVVHVEPKISHHIRFVLDEIFGETNFKNEIVWVSGGNHASTKQLQRNHDVIIVYRKSRHSTYYPEYTPYDTRNINKAPICEVSGKRFTTSAIVNRQPHVVPRPNLRYEWNGHYEQWYVSKQKMQALHDSGQLYYSDPKGVPRIKKYIEDMRGIPIKDVWNDIKQIQGYEKLDYATQKPILLLNRIIKMFSHPDSIVLDPCAGSGTVGRSAITTNRKYILFDINPKAKQEFENSLINQKTIPSSSDTTSLFDDMETT